MSAIATTAKYIAYVFDLWADTKKSEIYSVNGGALRNALNDPTLPNTHQCLMFPPRLCRKDVPHYGEIAPAPTTDVPGASDVGSPTSASSGAAIPPTPTDSFPLQPRLPPPASTSKATAGPTTAEIGSPAIQPSIAGSGSNEPAFTEAECSELFRAILCWLR